MLISVSAFSQEEDVYYNNKKKYKTEEKIYFPFHIYAELIRPINRDISINFEAAIYENTTLGLGFGYYRPGDYKFNGSFNDEDVEFTTTESGIRVVGRIRTYYMEYIDGAFGSLDFAYSKIPGFEFTDFSLNLGGLIPVYKNIVTTFSLGVGVRSMKKNIYSNDQAKGDWVGGFRVNLTLGYRFNRE